MKKIGFVLFFIGLFLFTNTYAEAAPSLQTDTTISMDGVEFTPIESPVDSSASQVKADTAKKDSVATKAVANQTAKSTKSLTLWETFLKGLLGGFLAFLMPCIFPMVPLTVSYIMKKGGSRKKGISQAIIHGLSIIVIYVTDGLLITE